MIRKHHPEFERGFRSGWWTAAAMYAGASVFMVLVFRALGIHAP